MLPARVHRIIYLVLLALLGGCMVTSVWASNLVWVLLGANWVFEGRWREKWQMARESRLLQALLALCLLYVVGMLWTADTAHGLSVLQVKLPLLVVPLVVLTSRPVSGRPRQLILAVYILAVLVVSIISTIRLFTIPDIPYREAVPYISHIRFALNCCMVVYLSMHHDPWSALGRGWAVGMLRMLLMIWMFLFLLLIHSYTAVAILALVSLVLILTTRRPRRRWSLLAAWLLLAGGAAACIGYEVHSYYRLIPQASAPLPSHTAGGRPYEHHRDGIIENGNYINNYICTDELRSQWQRRSSLPYDSIGPSGYTVHPTLIRYLNALGLTKDSVGVSRLTAAQIADVERGVANPVYENGNPLRKMVYVILFEYEHFTHTHAVQGFSMLQRFELWQATLDVIGDNLWFGVGTGDADGALHARLAEMDSCLADTTKSTHNQYLSLLATFGIVGFVLLLFLFLRPLFRRSSRLTPLMLAWLLTILISFLTEDTLNTLAGILFCTFFLILRPHTPTTDDKPTV